MSGSNTRSTRSPRRVERTDSEAYRTLQYNWLIVRQDHGLEGESLVRSMIYSMLTLAALAIQVYPAHTRFHYAFYAKGIINV
jgi:hypothetical protein